MLQAGGLLSGGILILSLLFLLCEGANPTNKSFRVVALEFDSSCNRNASLFEQVVNTVLGHPDFVPMVSQIGLTVDYRLPLEDCLSGGLYPLVTALAEPDVRGVVGAVADHVCEAAAALASVHKKLFVSWTCSSSVLSDKTLYPSFARSVSTADNFAKVVSSILEYMGWKFSVLLAADSEDWLRVATEIDRAIRARGFVVRGFVVMSPNASTDDVRLHLEDINSPVKVIILSMDIRSSLLLKILQLVDEMDMADGRFAFFLLHPHTTLHPIILPAFKRLSINVLRSLFMVSVVSGDSTYPSIWQNQSHRKAFENVSQTSSMSTAYEIYRRYDAVSLLLMTIRTAWTSGVSLNDADVSSFSRNAFYPTLLGYGMTDNQADRRVHPVVLDYDPVLEEFRDVTQVMLNVSDISVDMEQRRVLIDWPYDRPIPSDPRCVIEEVACAQDAEDTVMTTEEVLSLTVSLLICLGIVIGVTAALRKKLVLKEMRKRITLTTDDLIMTQPARKAPPLGLSFDKPDILRGSYDSLRPPTSLTNAQSRRCSTEDKPNCARLNGDLVYLKYIIVNSPFEVRRKSMQHLCALYELRHENINPFLGCLADPERPALVWEYCSRGSLYEILAKDDMKLDWSFKLSLLTDLVRGMRYLHNSAVKYHGRLSSRNCLIDIRWVLKLTDYALPSFLETQNLPRPTPPMKDLLWSAPELLRNDELLRKGSQHGDVYSFSIVMQEVLVRGEPYCMLHLSPEEIVEKLKHPPPLIRPSVSKQTAPPEAINIMRQCWAEQPDMRPDFNQINDQFKYLNHGRKVNIVDTMFQMLERYSNNLEDLIKERTLQLDEERKKTEQLLHRMLPSSVAENLKAGLPVIPDKYEEVTIYFSDIVGFTTISAYSEPMEIVNLLNDLYTTFDSTINHYNVYKVETIGDAYMVVGGIPQKIEDHAEQVATMALELLHVCGQFKIRHMVTVPLMLRIGLHTGPVVAGVVGLTMPRYCLFGDTVNTASRMESTSRAYRIHMSKTTARKLREVGGYKISYRGEIVLKGKGKHSTYWLTGKEGFDKELPDPPADGGDSHGFKDEEIFKALGRKKADDLMVTLTDTPSGTPLTTTPSPRVYSASDSHHELFDAVVEGNINTYSPLSDVIHETENSPFSADRTSILSSPPGGWRTSNSPPIVQEKETIPLLSPQRNRLQYQDDIILNTCGPLSKKSEFMRQRNLEKGQAKSLPHCASFPNHSYYSSSTSLTSAISQSETHFGE